MAAGTKFMRAQSIRSGNKLMLLRSLRHEGAINRERYENATTRSHWSKSVGGRDGVQSLIRVLRKLDG